MTLQDPTTFGFFVAGWLVLIVIILWLEFSQDPPGRPEDQPEPEKFRIKMDGGVFSVEPAEAQHIEPVAEKTRTEALSDGVFAVALTLLIVDMSTSAHVDDFYKAGWSGFQQPEFIGFLYSSFVAAVFWVAHHNEMNLIRRPTRLMYWINFAFLDCIVFLPFSTALLAKHWDPYESTMVNRLPVLIYAGNLLVAGIFLQILWTYAIVGKLLHVRPGTAALTWWRNLLIPAASITVMMVSWTWPERGPWVVVIVPAVYFIYTLFAAGLRELQRPPAEEATAAQAKSA